MRFINQAGLDLIKEFEGLQLKAYRCSARKLTIGYGHTKGVYAGQEITQEQAESYLMDDLQDAQRKDMQKHEIEASEKFGRIHTAMESFIGSIGRIDSNMTEMRNDIKELIRK